MIRDRRKKNLTCDGLSAFPGEPVAFSEISGFFPTLELLRPNLAIPRLPMI